MNFLVHYLVPFIEYLFFAGLIGAVPVIIITACSEATLLKAALDEGARGAFVKPLGRAELLDAIAARP